MPYVCARSLCEHVQWKHPRAALVEQLLFPRLTVNHLRYDPGERNMVYSMSPCRWHARVMHSRVMHARVLHARAAWAYDAWVHTCVIMVKVHGQRQPRNTRSETKTMGEEGREGRGGRAGQGRAGLGTCGRTRVWCIHTTRSVF